MRADAARNREKLLAAAGQVFGARGLDAPLDHIAREAGVSIGTLYAHFPTRDAFLDAIFPARLTAVDEIGAAALADPDPWHGFTSFLEGVLTLQAADRGLNDVLTGRVPLTPDLAAACERGAKYADELIARARASGDLRTDFQPSDLVTLMVAMSRAVHESPPHAWRRLLTFLLDGLHGAER